MTGIARETLAFPLKPAWKFAAAKPLKATAVSDGRRAYFGDGKGSFLALKLEDGSDYGLTGQLEFSEQVVDPSTGAVTLRARFPNPSGLLLPGMFVRATIAQATARGAVLVPQGALTRNAEGQASVFVVGAGNRVERRAVKTGTVTATGIAVVEGLSGAEQVVMRAGGFLQAGETVNPKPVAAAR